MIQHDCPLNCLEWMLVASDRELGRVSSENIWKIELDVELSDCKANWVRDGATDKRNLANS
jgi:hypothetical protein